ncbi:MAG: hypothetical protein AB1898_24090 [Acidobacteriota bacterium]
MAIALVSCACWFLQLEVRRSGNRTAAKALQAATVFSLLAPLNLVTLELIRGLQTALPDLQTGHSLQVARVISLSSVVLFMLLSRQQAVTDLERHLLLILSPLFFISLSYSAWLAWTVSASAFLDKFPVPLHGNQDAKPRVVILVFDELDQRLAFNDRPPDVQLPVLDSLRSRSIYAIRASSPSGQTIEFIPAILAGQHVSDAVALLPGKLKLKLADSGRESSWGALPNLFSAARAAGANCAVAGWFHPYRRIFSDCLSDCTWAESLPLPALQIRERAFSEAGVMSSTLQPLIERQALISIDPYQGIPLAVRPLTKPLKFAVKPAHLQSYWSILSAALRTAADPCFSLVFIHWPIPHPLGFMIELPTRSTSTLMSAIRIIGN